MKRGDIVDIGDIRDGLAFEAAVLGVSSDDICKIEDHFESKMNGRNKFIRFVDAVGYVKGIQKKLGSWNPKEPPTKIAKNLFDEVSSHLGNKKESLRLYSSIGTVLDYEYRADCFFVLSEHRYEAIVTIDLTINVMKTNSRVDFILTADDFRDDNRHQEIAKKIADCLLCRIECYKISNRRR